MRNKNHLFHCAALLSLALAVAACDLSGSKKQEYDKKIINSTKLCSEIKYNCLGETKNDDWRKKLAATKFELTARDKFHFVHLKALEKLYFARSKEDKFYQIRNAAFDLPLKGTTYQMMTEASMAKAAELLKMSREKIMSDDVYVVSKEELAAIRKEEKLRMYDEITRMLDLYFPGYWDDTPQDERIKWIMQVEKLGTKIMGDAPTRGALERLTLILAIIGTNFDKKPENKPIVDYLNTLKQGNHGQLQSTLDYLFFVVLKRDYDDSGSHLNDWSMRGALGNLPRPKRHVPSFPDELPDGKAQNHDYSIFRIYEDTIREGGLPHDPKDHEPIYEYMKTLNPDGEKD